MEQIQNLQEEIQTGKRKHLVVVLLVFRLLYSASVVYRAVLNALLASSLTSTKICFAHRLLQSWCALVKRQLITAICT